MCWVCLLCGRGRDVADQMLSVVATMALTEKIRSLGDGSGHNRTSLVVVLGVGALMTGRGHGKPEFGVMQRWGYASAAYIKTQHV